MAEEESQELLQKQHSPKPFLLDIRASKGFTQLTVAISIFTDDVLYGIVVPVLPNSLKERFGLPDDEIQKWVSIFLAVFGASGLVTALISGYITDRSKSRQGVFMSGLVGLSAATVLLYVGNSLAMLTIARALQGMATAIVHTVGIAMVVDKSPPEELGRALGIVGASMTAAVLFGPLLGGILYKYAGYHAVFGLSFGLLGLDIILRLLMIEKPVNYWETSKSAPNGYGTQASANDLEHDAMDAPSDTVTIGECSSSGNGDEQLPSKDEESSEWIPSGAYLLASPRVLVCLLCCVMNASMLTCFDSTLPIFVRETFGWNPAKQGVIFLTIAIPSLFAPLTGYLSDKVGVRVPISIGFIVAVPAFTCLSFVKSATTEQEALLCILLIVIGICLTLIHPATMAEVNHAVRAEVKAHPARYPSGATGQANAIRNCAFSSGITVGPLYAGFVKAQFGWPVMVSTIGAVSLLTAPLALLWAGGWLFKAKAGRSFTFSGIGFTVEQYRSLANAATQFWKIREGPRPHG